MQIAQFMASSILNGDIPQEYLLPGQRQLAALFDVSINTIIHATHVLQDLHLIQTEERSRSVVRSTRASAEWNRFIGTGAYSFSDQNAFFSVNTAGNVLHLSAGLSPDYFFRDLFNAIIPGLHIAPDLRTSPLGLIPLRETLSRMMQEHGIAASPGQVMIVTSIAHGLSVLLLGLLGRKTTLLTPKPCPAHIASLARIAGSRMIQLDMDRDGILPGRLNAVLDKNPQAVLCIAPDCNIPTGIVTSLRRREEIALTCVGRGVPVIEHTVFPPECSLGDMPPIKALIPEHPVVYLSQVGTATSTNPWLGWVIADEYLLQSLKFIRADLDAHQNYLMQVAALEVFSQNMYADYLKGLKQRRITRQAEVQRILETYLSPYAEWNADNLDATVWLRLDKRINVRRMFVEASDITFHVGTWYGESYSDHVRLSPLALRVEDFERGVRSLATLIRSQLET